MAPSIPYLASPNSIKTALEKIRQAATPDRVTGDFVTTKLNIKGGTGAAIIPFLKKIGLVGSDGVPTNLYKQFRNEATGKAAIASAVKAGYKSLGDINEYFYDLSDKDLKSLIVQVSGAESESSVVKLTLSTFKALKTFASFEESLPAEASSVASVKTDIIQSFTPPPQPLLHNGIGMNLSYTINLNLPPTSDQAVFNAIFRSLKEFLSTDAK